MKATQATSTKLNYVMKESALEIHLGKSGLLVMGEDKFRQKTKDELTKEPIMFSDLQLKQKTEEKYLGDMLSAKRIM